MTPTPAENERVRRSQRASRASDLDHIEIHPDAAAPDLHCWLWAAFAPYRGHLHTARVAEALGVSPSTVRTWVRLDRKEQQASRARREPLDENGMRRLTQRAILRGRGHYLWPPVDETILNRSRSRLEAARAGLANATTLGPSQRDKDAGRTQPHTVHLVHYGGAHVYGLAISSNPKTEAKILTWPRTELLDQLQLPNEWTAVIIKERALAQVAEHRVICPAALIPSGRTETWLETAGPIIDLSTIATTEGVTGETPTNKA